MKQATSPPARDHKWLFRLTALVVMPLLALAVLEGALRLAGYGYATGLFEKVRIEGKDWLLNNEKFSLRFFPPELSRWPNPLMMEPVKPAGTCRVFIFGESAAQGDPEPSFGAVRYLEVMLRERYPGVNFEVVNVAITAINSHVIVPIARECAGYQGDLWIVYMGNNEMIGPFGAATVFGAKAPPWPVVRLGLALQTTRVSGNFSRTWDRKSKAPRAGRVFGADCRCFSATNCRRMIRERKSCIRTLQRNLRDILRAGRSSGAGIILNTVAVNLKDCPPFASIAAGKTTRPADVEYGEAESLLTRGDVAAAREEFQKACDDDALPFRADSRINGIIREAARQMSGPDLVLCDAANSLPEAGKIPGQETFYEHVHFNFDGNYRLAMLWATQAERLLPGDVKNKAKGGWASQEVCEARLGLTDWNRCDVFAAVRQRMERAPLSSQANNDRRVSDLAARIDRMLRQRDSAAATNARALYNDAIARAPRDYMLHENFGEFLELTGNIKQAALEWRQARELMPRNPFAYLTEGQLLEKQADFSGARNAFLQAVTLHPRYAEAWFELGKLDAIQANLEDALKNYQHSAALNPNDAQTYLYMGKALSLLKRSDESVRSFRRALELEGANWEAHYALGGELGMHGQFAEAKTEFQQVVRLQPQFAMGHLNLGVALLKLNDPQGARQQFNETLRLDPGNKTARGYLGAGGK
jgi:tetratricopeptide (TPR) repeat protein